VGNRPDACGLVQGGGERVLDVVLDLRQEAPGLDVGAVAAALQRYAAFAQPLGEALGLLHDPVNLGLVAHL
jgi:hypothetical protein